MEISNVAKSLGHNVGPAVRVINNHDREVESIERIRNGGTRLVRIEDKVFYEAHCLMADPPKNTHLKDNFSLSFPPIETRTGQDWGNLDKITYLKLRDGIDAAAFGEKIRDIADAGFRHLKKSGASHIYFLQPLKDVHFHSSLRRRLEAPGYPTDLKIPSGVAAFLLAGALLPLFNSPTSAEFETKGRFRQSGGFSEA